MPTFHFELLTFSFAKTTVHNNEPSTTKKIVFGPDWPADKYIFVLLFHLTHLLLDVVLNIDFKIQNLSTSVRDFFKLKQKKSEIFNEESIKVFENSKYVLLINPNHFNAENLFKSQPIPTTTQQQLKNGNPNSRFVCAAKRPMTGILEVDYSKH